MQENPAIAFNFCRELDQIGFAGSPAAVETEDNGAGRKGQ